jgi:hypothetical protein
MWFPTDSADLAHRTLRASFGPCGQEEEGRRGPFGRSSGEGSEGTKEGMIMATPVDTRVESSVPEDRDRIVRRLDEYPELKNAIRRGDVPTGRYLCAQLFNREARQGSPMTMRAKA